MPPPSDLKVLEKKLQLKVRTLQKDHKSEALSICKLILSEDASVELVDYDGANNYTAVDGVSAPAASSARAFSSKSNPIRFEIWLPWNRDQKLDDESVANTFASLAVKRAVQKLGRMAFTLLFGARAVPHPDNGKSGSPLAPVGGGTLYAVDNITVTPINGGTPFNRTNDGTSLLTPLNLETALDKRPSYIDRDGGQSTAPESKPYLVVVSALGSQAKAMYEQKGPVWDGTGLRPGFADRLAGVVIAPDGSTAATNAWSLVYLTEVVDEDDNVTDTISPICIHLREEVKARVDTIPGTGAQGVYCDFAADVFFHPMVDRDLVYNEA